MTLILNGTDNSATTPAVTGTDTDTGVFFPAANVVAFSTSGTEDARFDASGNFLIGQTSLVNTERMLVRDNLAQSVNILVRNDSSSASAGSAIAMNAFGNVWALECGSAAKNSNALTWILDYKGANLERLRLNTDGTLILRGGSTSATGTGITFPATQSASSNANTLDDYEEGSFTPTWTGSSSGSVTTGQLLGQYTKVGNLVTVWIAAINPSATTLGGDWKFSLPFTISGFNAYFTGNVGYTRFVPAITGCAQNVVWTTNGNNFIYMARNSTTTGETTNQSGNVTQDTLIGITFTYPTAT
jgi:hypothetical protein